MQKVISSEIEKDLEDKKQPRRNSTTRLPSPLASPEIESIWIGVAERIGWRIVRSDRAYASSSGAGVIEIGIDSLLDEDDSVAQLIFHELCHGLIEGPPGWSLPDWGLSNCDDQHVDREYACLRLQIALTEPFALRELMAPTTEYRVYHDAISGDPVRSGEGVASQLAGDALNRADSETWRREIRQGLADTRAALDARASLGAAVAPSGLHPVGFPFGGESKTCGGCAWFYRGGRGRAVNRCRQAATGEESGRRTEALYRGCVRWEAPVDCLTCGACCREAYHSVTVAMRDPVVWKRPELIVREGHRFEIRREGERCAALSDRRGLPVLAEAPLFSCNIYEDRPRPCREFEAGGRHCLVARRRVGLSRHEDHR